MATSSKPPRSAIGALLAAALLASLPAGSARAQEGKPVKVTFGTDRPAAAEYGGFYQALAAGLYKRHGLEVTIRQSGPNVNLVQNVTAGAVDFQLIQEPVFLLSSAQENLPVIALAAFFQKSARVLIAHPGQGNDTLEQLKGKPILISASARNGFWLWLKAKYGYTDGQIRPYNFNVAPFLADQTAAQQGLLTSEPATIEKAGGVQPVVILLADHGYPNYGNLMIARSKLARERPEVVQAFIDASIEGWYSYLYGDPSPGNALILKDDKEMTPALIGSAIALIKQSGLADSGDALSLGIGAMAEARWQAIFEGAAAAGLYPASLDWRKAFTLEFVNQQHALAMRK